MKYRPLTQEQKWRIANNRKDVPGARAGRMAGIIYWIAILCVIIAGLIVSS